MKQFYLTTVLLALIFFTQQSWGQIKLGDNPQSIDPSTLLELESTTQGLLLPRMTSAQRDAIPMETSPVGLVIFNTDTNALQYLFEEITTNAKGEQRQVLRWESATDDSIPFTQPSNPEVGELYYDRSGGILHLWDGNQWIPVGGPNATTNSGGATTTVTYQSLSLVGNQLSISNGNTVDLSSLVVSITGPIGPQGPAGSPATDDQSLAASPLSANNTMTLAISGGNTITLDLSVLDDSGTDSQTLSLLAGSTSTTIINLNGAGSTSSSLTLVAGDNITLTENTTTGVISITATGSSGGGGGITLVTEAEKNAMTSATNGTLVYQTNGFKGIYAKESDGWRHQGKDTPVFKINIGAINTTTYDGPVYQLDASYHTIVVEGHWFQSPFNLFTLPAASSCKGRVYSFYIINSLDTFSDLGEPLRENGVGVKFSNSDAYIRLDHKATASTSLRKISSIPTHRQFAVQSDGTDWREILNDLADPTLFDPLDNDGD
ncbi:MAG: hypothetical protein ACPG8F_01565 [Flavobacteriaceae bacterium]